MYTNQHGSEVDISALEFELLVKRYLEELGTVQPGLKVSHNVNIPRSDGDYQIDVYAELAVLGLRFKILAECKRYRSSIKREVVQLLYDKLRATRAQKGILFSTSGFQSGAVRFAEVHGIALVKVLNNNFTHYTRLMTLDELRRSSSDRQSEPKFVCEFRRGNTLYTLQSGNLEPLMDFLLETTRDK